MSATVLLLIALALLGAIAFMGWLVAWEYRNLLRDEEEARADLAKRFHRYKVAHPAAFQFRTDVRRSAK